MFYIILVIAGIALAANRKQQASASVETPATVAQADTIILPHFIDLAKNFAKNLSGDIHSLPTGPGIGASLSANNPAFSNVIVSGPNIYKPGGPPAGAPAGGAPAGGAPAAAAAAPSGSPSPGTGGTGYGPPVGLHFPNTL